MSVRVMALVWERFPSGGTALLALLALADWANDDGENCHPSIASISRKIRTSESQARRVVHGLIQDGWLQVVGNEFGGAPKATRQYRIDIAKLEQTPGAYARGSTGARGGMGARDGSHPCAETGRIAMTPNPSIDPSLTTKREKRSRAQTSKGTRFTLETLPDDWQEFARKERSDIDPVREFQIFADYWRAQPGQKGVKVDWAATWRNWIRREPPSRPHLVASGRPVDNVRTLLPGEFT